MTKNSQYKYLVMYNKDGRLIFSTTSVSIATFEFLIGQRVISFWELDEYIGVKQ